MIIIINQQRRLSMSLINFATPFIDLLNWTERYTKSVLDGRLEVGKLKALEIEKIEDLKITDISGLTSITELIALYKGLKTLELCRFFNLESLNLDLFEDLNLESLVLQNTAIRCLNGENNSIKKLKIERPKIFFMNELESLLALESLTIQDSHWMFLSNIDSAVNLKSLTLKDNNYLESINDISLLDKLMNLSIENSACLKTLKLKFPSEIQYLNLKNLYLSNLDLVSFPKTSTLHISSLPNIKDFSALSSLNSLHELWLGQDLHLSCFFSTVGSLKVDFLHMNNCRMDKSHYIPMVNSLLADNKEIKCIILPAAMKKFEKDLTDVRIKYCLPTS